VQEVGVRLGEVHAVAGSRDDVDRVGSAGYLDLVWDDRLVEFRRAAEHVVDRRRGREPELLSHVGHREIGIEKCDRATGGAKGAGEIDCRRRRPDATFAARDSVHRI